MAVTMLRYGDRLTIHQLTEWIDMNELEARLLLEKIEVYAAQNKLLGACEALDRGVGMQNAFTMVGAYAEDIKEAVLGLVESEVKADDAQKFSQKIRLINLGDQPVTHGSKIRVFRVEESHRDPQYCEEGLVFTLNKEGLNGWLAEEREEAYRVFGENCFYNTEIKEFEIINTEEEGE